MSEEGEQDDPDVRESVDSFRRAGKAANEGLGTLYEWSHMWIKRRHSLVQFCIASLVWFGGNWTYNRLAPLVIEVTLALLRWMSSGVESASVFDVLENRPVFVSVQILVILLVAVIVQNHGQTQKLKDVESKLATMSGSTTKRADGGTREPSPTGPRAIGGAVIGATIGISFGPGGVLAGIYLGFWIGALADQRAYERDPLTPDLNGETRSGR